MGMAIISGSGVVLDRPHNGRPASRQRGTIDAECRRPAGHRGCRMLTTGEARLAAARWVREELGLYPELVGALLAGSSRERAPESPHPDGSDVDVWVIVDAPVPDSVMNPGNRFATRKLHFGGVTIERGFFPWAPMADPERVLGDPYLAPNLAPPVILADPSGRLRSLAEAVGPAFPRRSHVRRRIEAQLASADRFCGWAASAAHQPPFHPLAIAPAQVAVAAQHAASTVSMAALRQPSPRRSFARAGEILVRHGRAELFEELLRALGSASLGRGEVERAFAELERAYDAAVEVRRTAFGLDYNVSSETRGFALAGVRELVESHPREAMYQLIFLRALAQNAIENDGSAELRAEAREGFRALLSALGLEGDARRRARIAEIRALLPRLRAGCEEILTSTPGVVEDGR